MLRHAALLALAVVPLSSVQAQVMMLPDGSYSDPVKARTEYKRSCDEGVLVVCNELAIMLLKGEGGPMDMAEVRRLFQRVCDASIHDAPAGNGCFNLAMTHLHGEGAAVDLSRVRLYLDLACAKGNDEGCSQVGRMFYKGEGGPVDLPSAREAWWRACTSPTRDGNECLMNGLMVYEGIGGEANPGHAEQAFEQGCKQRNGESCYHFGGLLAGSESKFGLSRAYEAYWHACQYGFAQGCNNVGIMLANGQGTAVNLPEARNQFRRACDASFVEGCKNLGIMLGNGQGGAVDLSEAHSLFRRACDGGVADACEAAETISK